MTAATPSRAHIDRGGFNPYASTAVATYAHNAHNARNARNARNVRNYSLALAFHVQVLGMCVRNNVVLHGPAMERFTRFPAGAQARDT